MTELLGDYAGYVTRAEAVVAQFVEPYELVQCDMLNYETPTNERYDEIKAALLKSANLLSEIEHGGRLISIFHMAPPLRAGDRYVPYVELLQPKPTRQNIDGIDSVFFVTNVAIDAFLAAHPEIAKQADAKGLGNAANPYVELKGEIDGEKWAVKLHDRNMGVVLDVEKKFLERPAAPPNYGNHVTL